MALQIPLLDTSTWFLLFLNLLPSVNFLLSVPRYFAENRPYLIPAVHRTILLSVNLVPTVPGVSLLFVNLFLAPLRHFLLSVSLIPAVPSCFYVIFELVGFS
jgi:hypothetical protein